MRITLFLLFFGILFSEAANSYSQGTEFTLHLKSTSIKEICEEIEKQSDFRFIFAGNTKTIINKKVDLTTNSQDIDEILNNILSNNQLTYKILDNQVVIYRDEVKNTPKEIEKIISELIVQQQKRQLTGRIFDKNAESIIGANIIEKGTTNGTITDVNGNFSLQVENNAVLQISYIGYLSQEINTVGKNSFEIILQEDTQALEEVVVIGYGTQKKANLTGSLDVISEKMLANRPASSVAQMIQGTSPNLNLSASSRGGEPGSSMTWNIRGIGSINGTDTPLVIIDGVAGEIDRIDPETVESITILKDASASAIYGSRAPFGVILVTTKKGKLNEPSRITYSNNFSYGKPLNIPHYYDVITWMETYNYIRTSIGSAAIYSDEQIQRAKDHINGTYPYEYDTNNPPASMWAGRWSGNANYDWPSMFYNNNALTMKHNINVEGGSDKTKYFISGGLYDQSGLHTWGNDSFKRYNFVGNIDTQVTDWLRVGVNTKYMRSMQDRPLGYQGGNLTQLFTEMIWYGPMTPYYNVDGTICHPLVRLLQDSGREVATRNNMGLIFNGELEPVKNWKTTFSYNYSLNNNTNVENRIPVWVNMPNGKTDNISYGTSASFESLASSSFTVINVTTSYEKRLLDKHYFKLFVGWEQEYYYNRGLNAARAGLFTNEIVSVTRADGEITLGNAIEHWATRGYFGRLNYNFYEKYLFEASFRNNGSSRFEKGSRWGFFPSASAGYVVSKENFWIPIEPYINFLKVRLSYGSLGNANVSNYLYLDTLPISQRLGRVLENERPLYAGMPGIITEGLTWETVTTFNIGIDANFLKNRLSLNFDRYNRTTTNMMGPAEDLPAHLGTSAPNQNNASLETTGFELALKWRDRISKDLSYNVGLSLGDSKTTILKYKNPEKRISTWYEGMNYGEIWGYVSDGFFQTQEELDNRNDQSFIHPTWRLGDRKYKDLIGDGIIDSGTGFLGNTGSMKVIGNRLPRYNFSITLGANWKGFDLNMFWQGIGKCDYLVDRTNFRVIGFNPNGFTAGSESAFMKNSTAMDFWRPADLQHDVLTPNPNARWPRPYFETEGQKNYVPQTGMLISAAYLRLKNLQIGYTIPQHLTKVVSIQKARIYISGENLLTFTKMPDSVDPEAAFRGDFGANASQSMVYPQTRNLSFGINVTF